MSRSDHLSNKERDEEPIDRRFDDDEQERRDLSDRVARRAAIYEATRKRIEEEAALPSPENERWKAVRQKRESLRQDASSHSEDWEEAWRRLHDLYLVTDRDTQVRVADEPFAAIMFYVEMGFYPPPELMIWMCDTWHEWLLGDDAMEATFLGPAVRKAGGYRVQKQKRRENMHLSSEIATRIRAGKTEEEAAAEVARQYRQGISGKSLLARLNKQLWYRTSKAVGRARMQQLWKTIRGGDD